MLQQVIPWNGKPIKFPGIYSGIDIDFYHSANICAEPSISSTGLRKIFDKSPKHYWDQSPYNDKADDDDGTADMILGGATHHLLLGQERFDLKYVVRPETLGGEKWHGSRPACKQWIANHKGVTIITPAMVAQIKGMEKALLAEPLIKQGLLDGEIEHSLIWKDKETGMWLRGRPDAMPNASLDFVDLKTTTSILDDDLQSTIYNQGYYMQAALIAEGCEKILGMKMNSFTLVFVEKKRPFCVEVVTIKDNDIDRGHRANRMALRKFAECWKAKKWHGPNGEHNDARYIEMTSWHQKQIDAKLLAGI